MQKIETNHPRWQCWLLVGFLNLKFDGGFVVLKRQEHRFRHRAELSDMENLNHPMRKWCRTCLKRTKSVKGSVWHVRLTYSQTYQPDWKSNKSYSWCQLNIMLINELCLMLDVTQHAPTLHGQTPCLKLAPRSNLLIHWETQIQVKNSKHDNTMLWGPNLIEHI